VYEEEGARTRNRDAGAVVVEFIGHFFGILGEVASATWGQAALATAEQ